MDYVEILNRFSYESEANLTDRMKSLDKASYQNNRDVINAIVLWKINRSVEISNETLNLLNSLDYLKAPLEAVEDSKVHKVIMELLSSKGIKLAVASAILHFYYPKIFPIIDQRSYRELMQEEYPSYLSKDKNKKYLKLYLAYIQKCYEFNTRQCPDISFEYVDKVLYQMDKEKGNKVKY